MTHRTALKYCWITLSLLIISTKLPAQIVTTRCDASELAADASPETALAYLSQDRQGLNTQCLINAMQVIRDRGYEPAIPVLIKYLDFKRTDIPGIPSTVVVRHMTIGVYPALDALMRFGTLAIPAAKKALNGEDLGTAARLNAAQLLWHAMSDKPDVIKLTAKAAQAAQDPDTTTALKKLANEMVGYCRPGEQQRCKDAANEQSVPF